MRNPRKKGRAKLPKRSAALGSWRESRPSAKGQCHGLVPGLRPVAAEIRSEMRPTLETHASAQSDTVPDARALAHDLTPYRGANPARSLIELAITLIPFILLWLAMWFALDLGYWVGLLLAVPAAGFLVRLFLIQHDCGHGAFFRRRATNDWIGRVLGVLTLTPYDYWKRSHAVHHATSGNLDRRGIGDIDTLTVREYLSLSWWGRLWYRIYRHPLVLFGIGPAYLFALQFRLPVGFMREGWRAWVSPMATNAAIAITVAVVIWVVGVTDFLVVHVPIALLAASIGVWLFYVQHQFDETAWATGQDWNVHDHALHGSSHYDLPKVLRWFTANIGVHHVHHLCSRIPFYRLQNVLRDHPELGAIGRLTPLQSLKCVRLVLWDEVEQRLISFSDLRNRL